METGVFVLFCYFDIKVFAKKFFMTSFSFQLKKGQRAAAAVGGEEPAGDWRKVEPKPEREIKERPERAERESKWRDDRNEERGDIRRGGDNEIRRGPTRNEDREIRRADDNRGMRRGGDNRYDSEFFLKFLIT